MDIKEEFTAMAEAYGQLRVRGLAAAFRAVTFPISTSANPAYVTIGELASEGAFVGRSVSEAICFE